LTGTKLACGFLEDSFTLDYLELKPYGCTIQRNTDTFRTWWLYNEPNKQWTISVM